jgi:hypothetical protein
MYRIIIQTPDKDVQIVAVDVDDLDKAFSIFARYHWRRSMATPTGIWKDGVMVGRALAGTDPDGFDRLYLQKVKAKPP